MFKKILNNKEVTENDGSEDFKSSNAGPVEEVAYITIGNGSDTLSHPIGNKLTIGSEVGELICKLPSISARHCTILKNSDVFCFIDHGSEKGTFLAGKRLEPGKTIFYTQGDTIKFGQQKAIIEYKSVPVNQTENSDHFEPEETPELPASGENTVVRNFKELSQMLEEAEDTSSEQVDSSDTEDQVVKEDSQFDLDKALLKNESNTSNLDTIDLSKVDVEEVEVDENILNERKEKKEKFSNKRKSVQTKNKKRKTKINLANKPKKQKVLASANIVQRFLAFVIEGLILVSFYNIFYVYVDIKNFFDAIPEVLNHYLKPIYQNYLKTVFEQFIFKHEIVNSVADEIILYPHLDLIISFLVLVLFLRIITVFFFGVTIGQKLVGLSHQEESIVKVRMKGFLREIMGIILFPLLVFDLPALFSKRTLKELVTKTQLHTPGVFISLFFSMILIPLLSFLYMVSPIAKGLEVIPPVFKKKTEYNPKKWEYGNAKIAKSLKLQFDDSSKIINLPFFEIEMKNNKRYLTTGLSFLDMNSGSMVSVKKIKEFSMGTVLKEYVDLNFFSRYFEPNLYKEIRSLNKKSPSFKDSRKRISNRVASDINDVYNAAFSLTPRNLFKHITDAGPMLAGHRDFREKMNGIISHPINWFSTIKLGESSGMLFALNLAETEQYIFIPHSTHKTVVYYLSIDPNDAAYKRIFHSLRFSVNNSELQETPSVELIDGFKQNIAYENFDVAQAVFEKYFMAAKALIEKGNITGLNNLRDNMGKLIQILKENRKKNKKLFLNLNELIQAIKNRDKKYFQIEETRTI